LAAQAREQDVTQKAGMVEKLVGTHQSAAENLEDVRQAVQVYEDLQKQRELLPEETEAYSLAQEGVRKLEGVMQASQVGMENLFEDKGVDARIQEEAQKEDKAFDVRKQAETEARAKVENLERDYVQLKTDFDSFMAEIDTEADKYRKLTVDFRDWVERFEGMKDRLQEVINASLSAEDKSKLNFQNEETDISALYYRTPENLTRLNTFTSETQEKRDNLGTLAFGLKRKLDAILQSDALKKLKEFLTKEAYKLEPREVFSQEVKSLEERKSKLFNRLIQLDATARGLGAGGNKIVDSRLIDDRLGQERKRIEEIKGVNDATTVYWKQAILKELR